MMRGLACVTRALFWLAYGCFALALTLVVLTWREDV
jgi:hypothetical protein